MSFRNGRTESLIRRVSLAQVLAALILLMAALQVGLFLMWRATHGATAAGLDLSLLEGLPGRRRDPVEAARHEKLAITIGLARVIQLLTLAVLSIRRVSARAREWHGGKLVIVWLVALLIGWLALAIYESEPWDVGFYPTPLDGLTLGAVIAVLASASVIPISLTWIWLGHKERPRSPGNSPSDSLPPVA